MAGCGESVPRASSGRYFGVSHACKNSDADRNGDNQFAIHNQFSSDIPIRARVATATARCARPLRTAKSTNAIISRNDNGCKEGGWVQEDLPDSRREWRMGLREVAEHHGINSMANVGG